MREIASRSALLRIPANGVNCRSLLLTRINHKDQHFFETVRLIELGLNTPYEATKPHDRFLDTLGLATLYEYARFGSSQKLVCFRLRSRKRNHLQGEISPYKLIAPRLFVLPV